MKTNSQSTINLVLALYTATEGRKALEKQEAQLKKQIKEIMGSDALLDAGDLCVMREVRNRSDLDKEAIAHDLGTEFLVKYSKRTEYEILSVKRTSLAGAI